MPWPLRAIHKRTYFNFVLWDDTMITDKIGWLVTLSFPNKMPEFVLFFITLWFYLASERENNGRPLMLNPALTSNEVLFIAMGTQRSKIHITIVVIPFLKERVWSKWSEDFKSSNLLIIIGPQWPYESLLPRTLRMVANRWGPQVIIFICRS